MHKYFVGVSSQYIVYITLSGHVQLNSSGDAIVPGDKIVGMVKFTDLHLCSVIKVHNVTLPIKKECNRMQSGMNSGYFIYNIFALVKFNLLIRIVN